jgi:O-methyltransferase involved in polyketide biosynthesis
MEAVTQYLTERGIEKIFGFLAKAAPGSRLVFTYVRKDFLDGRSMYGWESGYKRFVLGKIWHYAFEPEVLPDFLKQYGWIVKEDKAYNELAEEYIKPSGRTLSSTSVGRIVYAEKI